LKIRLGFVSNSSSSSFVLSKKELTPNQKKGFSSWVDIHNETFSNMRDDHCIYESTNYFFGQVDYHSGLKEQLTGLVISKDKYDLDG